MEDVDEPIIYREDRDWMLYATPVTTVKWRTISLERDHAVQVSSEGCTKPVESLFQSTYGWHIQGTPYRQYLSPSGTAYLMHELVWRAFYGDIPLGWYVGHRELSAGPYSNDLENLVLLRIVA